MQLNYANPYKIFKQGIRESELGGIKTGGENSLLFLPAEIATKNKPLIACEILTEIPVNYPSSLINTHENQIYNPVECVKFSEKMGINLLTIKFNIENIDNIVHETEKAVELLKEIISVTNLPIIAVGTFKKEADTILLPALAECASRKITIGAVEEENYKKIAPVVRDCGHNIIARTPIDINLTKQLNILLTEIGFEPDKILIDPNTGGLGYGLDYAYSIIERIKLAALGGDMMLNMPVIAFVGEEVWKTKEARSFSVPESWGTLENRAIIWECITAVSMLVSGANIVVMRHPTAIKQIQEFIDSFYTEI